MSALTAYRGLVLSHDIEDYPEGIIVPIDKPYRWTSADVIRKVKWMAIKHFKKKNLKVGHAGTLDPLATGILLVCIGKATKLADELQKSPKQYLAGISFGATTPSYDREKEIDAEYPVNGMSKEKLEDVLPGFVGEQEQVAPLFSAKSVGGVRAYEMARKLYRSGQPIGSSGLSSSRINIYNLELVGYDTEIVDTVTEETAANSRIHVNNPGGCNLVSTEILVDCSKGTYIRALARDLGEAMDTGAFLHSLRRTKNGGIGIADAVTLEDIAEILKPAADF